MNCIGCGTALPADAGYCSYCGLRQNCPPPSDSLPKNPKELKLARGIFFLDNILSLIAVGVLAAVTAILFAVGSQGFTDWDAPALWQQFFLLCPLAIAALCSARTGGLDLSAGAVMALSSVIFAVNAAQNNIAAGLLMSLCICAALGLLNGMFIMVARIPSLFVTVASAVLVRGIALWAGGAEEIALPAEWADFKVAAAVTALAAALGAGIFLLWRTRRFVKNPAAHNKMKYFWIYGLLSAICAVGGWAAAVCFGAGSGNIGSGSSNEMIILFIFAAVSASALFKNNWLALLWALLLALLWAIHDQAMILLNLNSFSMWVSNASWVFILLAILAIAKRSWRKPWRA